ncbi:MAG: HIT domain-containing protein [Candidatus Eisenbacteria bacterium]
MEELWTPWRMRYITSPPPKDGCVFCRLLEDDGASELVLFRGRHSFVVMNLYPYSVGHTMVVPYRHLPRTAALTTEELGEIVHSAGRTERVLREHLGAETVHYGINLGRPAGAGVEGHVHLHLVPRGGRIPSRAVQGSLPVPLEETTLLLKDAFAAAADSGRP